jgi:hypothetical protein
MKCGKTLLIAGCHSGNILLLNTKTKKFEIIEQAHSNLIRCVVSLDYIFKGAFFVSADVCGFLKIW